MYIYIYIYILSSCSLSAAKFENVMKFKKYSSWEFEKYSS